VGRHSSYVSLFPPSSFGDILRSSSPPCGQALSLLSRQVRPSSASRNPRVLGALLRCELSHPAFGSELRQGHEMGTFLLVCHAHNTSAPKGARTRCFFPETDCWTGTIDWFTLTLCRLNLPTLLGSQHAEYSGEGAPAQLRCR